METLSLTMSDGQSIHCYRWLPTGPLRATVQITHGMGEHAARYEEFANRLTEAGYAVYANDLRGHGNTAHPDALGDMGDDGWNRTIEDAYELHRHLAAEHQNVKRAFFGHSMGAMLTQQFLYRHGEVLDTAIISGSPGIGSAAQLWLSHTIARFERWRLGPGEVSNLMQNLVFGSANKPFDEEGSSGFEWLSRDQVKVARYANDPLCGFVLRTGSLCDLFAGAREARQNKNIINIPTTLPIYIFSGSADPVHNKERDLLRLVDCYRTHGNKVTYRLYPEGRHEMLNEINCDAVIGDVLHWLDSSLWNG
ncbi:MAG: alpha/beta fold hydrolase [Gammaproteobacteria bacterium]|nr:alpha/beta fold hydrolase [Gammaproteobacteria bacterium]